MIPRIATPFGGGISEHSYICGALSGALMAIGLKYGRDNCNQEREPAKERAGRFIRRFIDKYSTVNCRQHHWLRRRRISKRGKSISAAPSAHGAAWSGRWPNGLQRSWNSAVIVSTPAGLPVYCSVASLPGVLFGLNYARRLR
jgi:C_GCAxxG_C_C family probable redox protein